MPHSRKRQLYVEAEPTSLQGLLVLHVVLMSQSYVIQAATMMCSKATVKTTGLNIWVSGEHNHNGPEVE